MKKIMILGDSLTLPRPENIHNFDPLKDLKLGVEFNETYPFLLQQNLQGYYVINRGIRASTIKQIYERDFFDHIILTKPDIVIIHVGIVDLWPRNEMNGESYISESEFAYYYIKLLKKIELFNPVPVICIGISSTNEHMEKKYAGVSERIIRYNHVLKNICLKNRHSIFIDMSKFITLENCNNFLMKDGIHLNIQGNRLVAEEICKIIDSNFNKDNKLDVYKEINLNISHLNLYQVQLLDLEKIQEYETVVIYGAGEIGSRVLTILQERGINVVSFIDSVKSGALLEIPIISFEEALETFFEKIDKIIVASFKYKDEILKKLEMFHFEKEKIITFPNTISLSKFYEVIEG